MAHSRPVSGVLFPAMAAAGPERLRGALTARGSCWVAGAVVPLAILLALFAGACWRPGWARIRCQMCKGRAASRAGHRRELRFLYSVHAVAGARTRRSDAKTHMAELPAYLVLLRASVRVWGIEGRGAWAIRCAADAGILFALAGRQRAAA